MKPVEIYTSPLCGFCHAAKRLLNQKGVEFSEIDIWADPSRKSEMMQRAHCSLATVRTAPCSTSLRRRGWSGRSSIAGAGSGSAP